MDSSIAKKTQETLGKVIKKPPLTEKLLSKPPFRFLHDVITEVIKNTGFMKGLYTSEEMNSTNVKDKEAKIFFLQRAIDVVGMVSDDALSVRPTKIVAGHEPEKTNEFLQMMGKAVLSKKSSTDAVKRVQNKEKPGKSSGDSKKRDSRSGSRERERTREQEKEKLKEKKERDGSGKKESDSRDRRKGEEIKRRDSTSKRDSSEGRKREDSAKRDKERDRSRQSEKSREKEKASKKEEDILDGIDSGEVDVEDGDMPPNRIPRPSSAKGLRRRPAEAEAEAEDSHDGESDGQLGAEPALLPAEQMNGVINDNEIPPQVAVSRRIPRPGSARPAPPKIKKQQDEIEDQVTRIGSGKQVAHVIVDDGKDQDDEDDTFVVEDTHVAPPNEVDLAPPPEVVEDDGEHGGLVRKIMETKKQLEASGSQQTKRSQERSAPIISDAARRKERELAQKEIEKLRSSIQTLTRSANPLGKIMDYIQEDMDSMQKEQEMWRKENREHAIALKREQSVTEGEIEPLKNELQELETEITEMVDRISAVKCKILRNDEKTQQMLSGISFASR